MAKWRFPIIEEINRALLKNGNRKTEEFVRVIHCKDCINRCTLHCPMYFEEVSEFDDGGGNMMNDYIEHDHTIDYGFCDRGERDS